MESNYVVHFPVSSYITPFTKGEEGGQGDNDYYMILFVKQVTPGHRDVRQGIGEDDEAVKELRGSDEHGSGLLGIQETFGDGDGVKIPWEGIHGIG